MAQVFFHYDELEVSCCFALLSAVSYFEDIYFPI